MPAAASAASCPRVGVDKFDFVGVRSTGGALSTRGGGFPPFLGEDGRGTI